MLEVYHPDDKKKDIKKLLKDIDIIDLKQEKKSNKLVLTRILISADKTDAILDILEKHFAHSETYRVIILPVEAAIPRPEIEKKDEKGKIETEDKERIGIEEIYNDICGDVSKFSKMHFVMIALAGIVASIGILYENVAVVIGSMVIAPLLHPSMALSLGITLADSKLMKNASLISFLGFFLAFMVGLLFGLFFHVDPSNPEILSRIEVNLMFVVLAFSSGIAGSLSVTRGVSEALVGVMTAVALLPPIVTSGLLLGSFYVNESIGAILLFMVNLVCINLAGVLTFFIQGINPKTWWEKKKAKKIVWKAVLLWITLLILLILLIVLYQYF
ncbi:MAG: TIGR00341 family protein [Candidatus Thermoplasmatota archaeon]|nr:TIGR00341 family protein [Candidatus Thermoplasmatota archaeon]